MVGMSTNVQMQTQSGGLMKGLKRLFGGESFFRNTFTEMCDRFIHKKKYRLVTRVSSKYGLKQLYSILYLKLRTEPHKANLTDDYQKIQSSALSEKQNKVLKEWVSKKQKSTAINIKQDYLSEIPQCGELLKDWINTPK